jgi:hypothetical protein
MIMQKNMGTVDRSIRAIAGLSLVIAYSLSAVSGTIGVVAAIAGGVFLITAAFGVCPAYLPLGIKTCK